MDDEKLRIYDKTDSEELIMRDWLAIDRTILANERTLLAYVRTGLAFIGAGVAFLHFFDDSAMITAAWVIIPVGVLICCYGVRRYITIDRAIKRITRPPRKPEG